MIEIPRQRMHNQRMTDTTLTKPEQVVSWLGAVQAQDYPGALWTVALRTQGATKREVEEAIIERKIIRTWPMRGTLHFVTPQDIRWMLKLLTPRIRAGAKSRQRNLGLDEHVFEKSRTLITKALEGGKQLTRTQMYEVLAQGGIDPKGYRALHIIGHLSQEGLLCFGAHQDRQPTFALLEEWVPKAKELTYEESLREITIRYFTSHGPATIQDFVWWTGLTVREAREGIELAMHTLQKEDINETTYWTGNNPQLATDDNLTAHLLPGFEEYLLGYKDRSAVLNPIHTKYIHPGGNGVFRPSIIINGKVAGTWQKVIKKDKVCITLAPFKKLHKEEHLAVVNAAHRYGEFLELPVVM